MGQPPAAASPASQNPEDAPDEDSALETRDDGITTLPPAPGFPD
jgi:hypothetical protein